MEALQWVRGELLVPATLAQIGVIAAAWALARFLAPKLQRYLEGWLGKFRYSRISDAVIRAVAPLSLPLIWLLLQWFSVFAAQRAGWPNHLIESVVSLLTAWVVIRLISNTVRDPGWAKTLAIVAWGIAALNLLGLLGPTIAVLDNMGLTLGEIRITLLGAIKAAIVLAVLLWLAGLVSHLADTQLAGVRSLSPSARVLLGKTFRIVMMAIAVVVALDSIGIDLTALAVFSGAVGLGIGFGLQKVVSNLISGLILLMDKSVKPGDVIAIGDSFGWINSLRARYVSVITRDGTEHLIPNEELISQRVENWSYSNTLIRLKLPIGISYDSDPKLAMELAVEAAMSEDRVRKEPPPVARFMNFGNDALELELRIWIADPQDGVANVRSNILLKIWESYRANSIEFPFGQRDLHIRSSVPIPVRLDEDGEVGT
ncbi:mechanosensitive ion channel [Rhodospirillaceae bacterium KN72]|uniref:Mechanosensitive ion channel n=1 Tax=Pacificispira spongiicola TaxID=2729598 RepID=A0A7Y0HFR2_9PROT|nr:mechanosensitive ion channel domain-containing protein [Pacificispira spongiicola]NMM46116.1 mechanosensitive ion channel [Pacificispira spongiicola]